MMTFVDPPHFERIPLHETHFLYAHVVPAELIWSEVQFASAWHQHPADFHTIKMFGRSVPTPRWQQAYGTDYRYTGRVNRALPVPHWLTPLAAWAATTIDSRLNGLLLNWYDAGHHYIGPHRDSEANRIPGTPIVTISFGAERIFRLRRYPRRPDQPPCDFPARHGSVFILPWRTNQAYTHEVPRSKVTVGHRISVTMRAFDTKPQVTL